jgi:hypothetical protein
MNNHIGSSQQVWLGSLTSALLIAAAPFTHAQQVPIAADVPPTTQKADTPAFGSALDGYRPYSEEKIVSWKEANDMTARIGGWRAYAKEASGAEAVPAEPAAANVKAKP